MNEDTNERDLDDTEGHSRNPIVDGSEPEDTEGNHKVKAPALEAEADDTEGNHKVK